MEFQTRSIIQQGYSHLTEAELRSVHWGLRFTPSVCMIGSIFGLVTHNAPLLFVLAVIGVVPFWFPAHHPLDLFYNNVVAPALGATRLPPNPLPRRIACVSGGVLNVAAGLLLLQGLWTAAYVVGGLLFTLQLVVNTTHFCLASFMIELGLRAVGKSLPTQLIDGPEARQLVERGAVLVDVRDPSEFAQGALPGARNIPVTRVREHADELRGLGRPIVLYCQSGGRAKIAHGLLVQRGVCGLHNLGGIGRW